MFRRVPANYFKSLTVWGGGTMGGGIGQVTAQAGLPVTIVEVSEDRIAVSRKAIEHSLTRIAKRKCDGDEAKMKEYVDSVVQRITWTTDEKAAAGSAEVIIEAIVENIDAKKELFGRIDKYAPEHTVFCSNTSSLSITQMASVTSRGKRFAGMHFFSPVPMMKLVEVVKTEEVDPKIIEELREFAKVIGKVPVVCKDTKGFIVNRLLVPYQMEAIRLVERGVATYEDVDTAMKLGCGYPMGPFELADSVGVDINKLVIDGWHKEFPDIQLFNPSKMLDDQVASGKLGKKTGEGFYKYDDKGRRVA